MFSQPRRVCRQPREFDGGLGLGTDELSNLGGDDIVISQSLRGSCAETTLCSSNEHKPNMEYVEPKVKGGWRQWLIRGRAS